MTTNIIRPRSKERGHGVMMERATGLEPADTSLGSLSPVSREGRCVYCNHCQPCPEGIQIGMVNKYYDLARQGDELARDHYMTLDAHASDCIRCGHCDIRCPFGVHQSERMQEIAEYFGR